VGQLRSAARRIWLDAGFTGAVDAGGVQGNFVIGSQTPAAGLQRPCDTGLTIAPSSG
jgi:hypothetical protein